ncbi:hydrogenase maturation protease [Leptothoe sp. PORK10 BA2]|uniref:hydrogenase maturation protease n=1 Tax=Leptothoe sp. PORK10 BA2 TaxID=3110254 RepID=UPI002B20FEA4|nr:hydrogenase maturation protease [Leptothoe sp. PORK10 BA2]MEA5463808.1 hydrogenase maturation protease [Leptothoe sp. PORK10 BA2]
MTPPNANKSATQFQFLIIGYGNELRGDDAAGPRVAQIVASWQLPSIKSLAVPQLMPELINDIADTNYVIFVDACSGSSCSSTMQLDPIIIGDHSTKSLVAQETHRCNPLSLLMLTKQLYDRAPQAWFLKMPVESFDIGKELSSTTKRGCDRAVTTIEQFIRSYRQPVWLQPEAYMKSA